MLTDDTPDTVIIQGEYKDVPNKNSNPEDIAKAIAKAIGSLGNLCGSHGENQVLISSLICRKNFHLNNKAKEINFLIKLIRQEDGFTGRLTSVGQRPIKLFLSVCLSVHPSVSPSLNFLKIGSLVFSDILLDDS